MDPSYTQFYHKESYDGIVRKPIKSPLYFEARFKVSGKLLQSLMCAHCEVEGELYVRVPRSPEKGSSYDIKNPSTYVDIIGFDSKGYFLKYKPGDLIEADIICFGYLRKIRAKGVWIENNTLASGNRKIGRISIDNGRLEVDFLVFKAVLRAQTEDEMETLVKKLKLRDGVYLETDCSVDIEVIGLSQKAKGGRRMRQRRN